MDVLLVVDMQEGIHLNSAFAGTSLASDLSRLGAERVLITGWATDLCVDATVRSAAKLGFEVEFLQRWLPSGPSTE